MTSLGALYLEGEAVPHDANKAQDWLSKAGAAGDADALFLLGKMYKDGKLVENDRPSSSEKQGVVFADEHSGDVLYYPVPNREWEHVRDGLLAFGGPKGQI